MLALASVLLSISALAFWVARARWRERVLGSLAAALGVGSSIAAWGVLRGSLVGLVLAMGSSSLLVLVLPARAGWALPLAGASGLAGAILSFRQIYG